jgi:Integrase core domain
MATEIRKLVISMATDNPAWGTGGCKASSSGSATRSLPPRCGRSCTPPGSARASPHGPDLEAVPGRAGQFTSSFDAVFTAEGIRILASPPQAPRANAICETIIGTLRRELFDRSLIVNEQHLRRVLAEYLRHYNTAGPHRALGQLSSAQAGIRPPQIISASTIGRAGGTSQGPNVLCRRVRSLCVPRISSAAVGSTVAVSAARPRGTHRRPRRPRRADRFGGRVTRCGAPGIACEPLLPVSGRWPPPSPGERWRPAGSSWLPTLTRTTAVFGAGAG